jgi:hypothetical protein
MTCGRKSNIRAEILLALCILKSNSYSYCDHYFPLTPPYLQSYFAHHSYFSYSYYFGMHSTDKWYSSLILDLESLGTRVMIISLSCSSSIETYYLLSD